MQGKISAAVAQITEKVTREVEDMIEQRVESVVRVCCAAGIDTEVAVRGTFAHNLRCAAKLAAEIVTKDLLAVFAASLNTGIPVSDYSLPGDVGGMIARSMLSNKQSGAKN